MGFASGAISFARYAVAGSAPKSVNQEMLDTLAEHALRERELGSPEEVEYGWVGGRHLFDADFSFDNNVFADCLSFGLRIDTNKPPAALKKAWRLIEEEALAKTNPSGFISKNQKREARETTARRIEQDLRTGKFRRSKLAPILWDLQTQTLLCPASATVFEKLSEIFARSFGLELSPITSGALAQRLLSSKARRRDYEDARPTRFVIGPEGESQVAEYPWAAKGPEPKDFLGNEFLLWLWHEAEARHGHIKSDGADLTLFIDRALDLDCAFGQSGRDMLRGDAPSRMPEARDALRSGKVPRKAGLIVEASRQQYSLTLGAESLYISGLKLPDIEQAESPRVVFEERIALLRDFMRHLDAAYESFLKLRTSSAWESHTSAIRRWIAKPNSAAAA